MTKNNRAIERGGLVYIMTNKNNTTLYTGVTSKLKKRVYEHINKFHPNSFTAKYQLNKLIYYESFYSIEEAIGREKQIEAGSRQKKIDLINKSKIMKKIKTVLIVTFYLLLSTFNLSAQSIGINATGAIPDSSALLDLSASNKGFLITRVDTANIPYPAFGLMTLAPSDSCLYMFNGTTWTSIGGIGTNCSISGFTPPSLFPCNGTVIPIVDITSTTGKIWMDRNLGASQVATSTTDAAAYGYLYQWGRCSDGHEKRSSDTTAILSATNTPGNGYFITSSSDWRGTQNDNLWQGAIGINNPCPTGYRLPTEPELDVERRSWSSNNAAGAFSSPLKLPMAGNRDGSNGSLGSVGTNAYYWSSTSTAGGANSLDLGFNSSNAYITSGGRAYGFSVRCIKD